MNKKWIIVLVSIVGVVTLASLWLVYTHSGKVTGLYLFSAFRAPLSEKVACMKETRALVQKKFELPLLFDRASKNALREFWHFSYYRACLFRAGYDFYGNPIKPSEIVRTNGESRYMNYFGGFSFSVPESTELSIRDVTDPDIEDRKISSTLIVDEHQITVLLYKNYEDSTTTELLREAFMHFENSTTTFDQSSIARNGFDIDVLTAKDADGNYGFSALLRDGKVLQVFGSAAQQDLLNSLAMSIQLIQ